LAKEVADERSKHQNQVREQLADQNKEFMVRFEKVLTISEYESKHELLATQIESRCKAMKSDIDDLKTKQAVVDGKASQKSVYYSYVVNAITLALLIWEYISHIPAPIK
jgi:hypothetical protein